MQDETHTIPLSDEWWDEQARLFGTTRIQTQFARVMIERPGVRLFEAARLAGAQGDHATLRTTGSRLNSNPKVQRLIEHAQSSKADETEVPPPGELLQMLGEISRKNPSDNVRITAMKTLLEYQDRFGDEISRMEVTTLLDQMCQNDKEIPLPFNTAIAILTVPLLGCEDWVPPEEHLTRLHQYPELIKLVRDCVGEKPFLTINPRSNASRDGNRVKSRKQYYA